MNNARTSPARPTNRRSQPRTVPAGTPNREAIGRHPSPATFASIASPITATSSWRRNKHNLRQQHMRPQRTPDTAPAAAPPPIPRPAAQHPLPPMPPRPQHLTTRRTPQQPVDQLSLDPRLLGAYDQHRVPPPASREPSRRRSIRREGSRAFRNPPSLPTPATARPDDQLREHSRACRNQASFNSKRIDVCLISDQGELIDRFEATPDRDGLYGLARRVAVYGEAVRGSDA